MSKERLQEILEATGLAEEEYADLTDWERWVEVAHLPEQFRQGFHIPEICFTGFGRGKNKTILKRIAKMNGFIVRDDVTKKLSHLCCGPEPGPSKVEKAEFQGVEIISFGDFLQLLEVESA